MSAEVTITEKRKGDLTATDIAADKGFWAKCDDCGHCWIAAYWPQEVTKFVKAIGKNPQCPKCASAKVMVAKQHNGVLDEPSANRTDEKD